MYACLTFMGNSSGEVGEGARGCRGEVWVGGGGSMEGGVGPYGKGAEGKKRRWEGRTDRDMEERTDYEKNPAKLKKTVEENSMVAGFM